jgi:hypothetical protein
VQDDKDDPTNMRQIAIRLPVPVMDRLEAHARRLRDRNPGVSVTRADAIRALLLDALDTIETKEGTRSKAKTS